MAQYIEIRDLTNNKGILPIDLGPARQVTGYSNLIHVINLNNYSESIDNINSTLKMFERNSSTKIYTDTTKIKLKELKLKLNSLMTKRTKRGLIDGVGHAIKFITGNMDAHDAQEINRQIEQLKSNQINFQNNMAKDHKFNLDMIARFSNITNHINEVQGTIELFLNRQVNQSNYLVKSTETSIREIQYLNQINYNIDILTSHINDISEAIILAKLNIIPKLILHPEEIEQISRRLESESIQTKSIENIYELLGLQAYYNETNIIFNVQIPNLDPKPYKLYHVIPLPINETKIIITEPYIMFNEFKIIYISEKCLKIENTFYCSKYKYEEATVNSSCIGHLFRNIEAKCVINDVGKTQTIWQPEPNLILFINIPRTQIETTCKIDNQFLNGTGIVHYKHCEVNINNITYSDDINTFWDDVYIAPASTSQVYASTEMKTITLKKLSDYNFIQQDEIISISSRLDIQNIIEALIWLFIIGVTIYILRRIYILKIKQSILNEAAVPSVPSVPTLQTGQGGVTYTLPTTQKPML